jgi:plastocyanin
MSSAPVGNVPAAALAVTATGAAAATGPRPASHVVTIEAMRFSPARLDIKAGDTVTWRNKDAFAHNARTGGKGFRSPDIPASGSWKYTASTKGEFAYVCTLHPGMKAVLVVR